MKPKNRETTVGLFLLGGIAIICTLIIFFGEMGDLFKPTYNLTVKFANASGLLKGSDVYLSGALIGKVTTDPEPIPDTQQVMVRMKINSTVRIRDDATFVIGSSGLLGDMYVEVRPHIYPDKTPEKEKKPYIDPSKPIEGATNPSIADLTVSAEPLIIKANTIADQLNEMITKLNKEILSGTSTDDLKMTIGDLRSLVKNANIMVQNGNDVLVDVKQSKGPLGLAINDRESAERLKATLKNLEDLSANLKRHGVLFYSDTAGDQKKK